MVASYRISRSLASGGMAEVFEADHAVLPRRVALKVMHPELLRKPDMDTRFLREACILESFSHPGGVRVFECGVLPDGRPWMAMELVHGHPMSKDMHQPMAATKVVPVLRSVVEVLAAAHAVGLIHRDLKPDNLLLADDDESYPVRVIDWGLARLNTFTRLTQDGTAAGTPLYMSPEQTQGKQLDGRCDVYSLGVVAYEALAGFPPFDGQNLVEIVVKQVTTEPTPLHQLRSDIPRELSDLVASMLTRDPANRPTAADLMGMLDTLAELMGPRVVVEALEPVEGEDPILEYSFERTEGELMVAAAGQLMSEDDEDNDDLELEIDVELGELYDTPAAAAAVEAAALSKAAAGVHPGYDDQDDSDYAEMTSEPFMPYNTTSDTIVLDHPIAMANIPVTRVTPAPARTPSQPVMLHHPLHPAVIAQGAMSAPMPAVRPPSEPMRIRPQATPQSEFMSQQAAQPAGRDETTQGTRMHWTPEPVRLENLPTGLAGRRRRRCEITPRGPSDAVAGELQPRPRVAIGGQRRS